MPYFQYLPKTLYSTNKEEINLKLIPNIVAKAAFIQSVIDNESLYFKYEIRGGETPEQIAYRIYGDPEKHWIILLANKLIDPQFDWALGPEEFDRYIKQKYGSLNVSLKTTESYPTGYTVGEIAYQGSSYDKSDAEATIVAYNSGPKTLQLKFSSQVLANGNVITGLSSAQTHTIVGITNNLDGSEWARNTTSHYLVTETRVNSADTSFSDIIKYKVSATLNTGNINVASYDFATENISRANVANSSSSSQTLSDGTTVTITTTYTPVSYYDYEVELNEAKRNIIVPKSTVALQLENQLANLMR